jgi:N-acylglucosamine 2-epimerase
MITQIEQLEAVYRDGLLHDTLPFWINHCVDEEHGGFMFCLDRDGTVIDTDKGMWQTCRFTWLLAMLYNTVERRSEWLELAGHGIDFIRKYGFDTDGRMFFQVTRNGEPIRKRRYLFTEAFAAIAFAAYAKASGNGEDANRSSELFRMFISYNMTPGWIESKFVEKTRLVKSMSVPMIQISVAQVLRETIDDPTCKEWIDRSIDEIATDFLNPDLKAVMETVGSNGEFLDHFDGRMLNPGHAIEGAWFILHEAKHRGNDPELVKIGITMLDWMWEHGWDKEYGGIFYFRDVKGLPVQEYWHDMKFWWPHCETIIATLLAYQLTEDEKYARWHDMIHSWTYDHFPDQEYGEWFGYLHRDGTISVPLKGNIWKGPFHIPRMQWYCWKLLEEMKEKKHSK